MSMVLQRLPCWAFVLVQVAFGAAFAAIVVAALLVPPFDARRCAVPGCAPVPLRSYRATRAGAAGLVLNVSDVSPYNHQLHLVMAVRQPARAEGDTARHSYNLTLYQRTVADTLVLVSEGERAHELSCDVGSDYCSNVTIENIAFVSYERYETTVAVVDFDTDMAAPLDEVEFYFVYRDEGFVLFELWLRFALMLVTLAVLFAYALRLHLSKYTWMRLHVEQRWTLVLLGALLLQCNPITFVEVLVPYSWVPELLDRVLQSIFTCLLLLFFLVIFDALRGKSANTAAHAPLRFYTPKVLFVAILLMAQIASSVWREIRVLSDPYVYDERWSPTAIFITALFVLFLVVYAVWLIYLMVRACCDARHAVELGVRVRFFLYVTLALVTVQIVAIVLTATRVMGVSADLVVSIGAVSLYVYFLALMYTPARTATAHEAQRATNAAGMTKFVDEDDGVVEVDDDSDDGGGGDDDDDGAESD